jgi:NADH-quinone oxidoreductase subunit N
LQAVLSAGYVWLAVVAVLFSLIGAFYYLRIVKLMYFDEPETNALILPQGDVKILLSANGLAVLAFGFFPQVLIGLCAYAIQQSI